jgi:hypothetical protein
MSRKHLLVSVLAAGLILTASPCAQTERSSYLSGTISASGVTRFQYKDGYYHTYERFDFYSLKETLVRREGYSLEAAGEVESILRRLTGPSQASRSNALHARPTKLPLKPYSVLIAERKESDGPLQFALSDSDEYFNFYKQELSALENTRSAGKCKLINNGCIKCGSRVYCLISK